MRSLPQPPPATEDCSVLFPNPQPLVCFIREDTPFQAELLAGEDLLLLLLHALLQATPSDMAGTGQKSGSTRIVRVAAGDAR